MECLKLVQLLRLSSPCLPIGGYTYSQGLENAIDTGAVHDSGSALAWIRSVLQSTQTNFECAAVAMACRFLEDGDEIALIDLNMRLLTSKDTEAQRRETSQMAFSLLSLLAELPEGREHRLPAGIGDEIALPLAWAHAARCFSVGRREALAGWLFNWLENQLLVLMKALPLGHTAAQRLLSETVPLLPRAVAAADALPFEDLSGFAPRLSFALMQHQFQYSRLFRT